MKLTAIAIQKWNGAHKEATSLGLAADVSSYGYFQRGPVQQMMAFVSRTVAQRTLPGQRQSVQQVSTSLPPEAGAKLRFKDHQRLCAGACSVSKWGAASYLTAALACKASRGNTQLASSQGVHRQEVRQPGRSEGQERVMCSPIRYGCLWLRRQPVLQNFAGEVPQQKAGPLRLRNVARCNRFSD